MAAVWVLTALLSESDSGFVLTAASRLRVYEEITLSVRRIAPAVGFA